jgi:hypothetical protein
MLAPYSEHANEDHGWWDWWQIGGRYTGRLSGYNPRLNPDNIETCDLCNGTGTRPDMTVANGCNKCDGKGAALKWPTQWGLHSGDIQRWGDVKAMVLSEPADADNAVARPYTAVVGEAFAHREQYVDDDSAQYGYRVDDTAADVHNLLSGLSEDAVVVVVDYHS